LTFSPLKKHLDDFTHHEQSCAQSAVKAYCLFHLSPKQTGYNHKLSIKCKCDQRHMKRDISEYCTRLHL